jgi:hypothetical protein
MPKNSIRNCNVLTKFKTLDIFHDYRHFPATGSKAINGQKIQANRQILRKRLPERENMLADEGPDLLTLIALL